MATLLPARPADFYGVEFAVLPFRPCICLALAVHRGGDGFLFGGLPGKLILGDYFPFFICFCFVILDCYFNLMGRFLPPRLTGLRRVGVASLVKPKVTTVGSDFELFFDFEPRARLLVQLFVISSSI